MNKSSSLPIYFNLKFLLGISISIIALFFAFHKIDFQIIWSLFKSVNIFYICASSFVLIASVFFLALRWRLILNSTKDIPFKSFVRGQFIGYFGNNIFPFRLGELIRSYYLSKQEVIEIPEIFGSIVVERFLDFVIIIIFIIILVSIGFFFPESITPIIWIFVGVGIFLGAFIYLFPHIKGINFKSKKLEKIRLTFIGGLSVMKDLHKLPLLIFLTCIIWFFYGLAVMFVFFSFRATCNPILILLILSFAAIGINVPSAPGAIGTHHMAVIIALKDMAGFDLSFAQGLSILYHAINYVPLTVIGFYFFTKFNMNLSEIKAFKRC